MWFLVVITLAGVEPKVFSYRPEPSLEVCLKRQEVIQYNMDTNLKQKHVAKALCIKLDIYKKGK